MSESFVGRAMDRRGFLRASLAALAGLAFTGPWKRRLYPSDTLYPSEVMPR